MKRDYNRYALLKKTNSTTDMMPFVNIPINLSDKYEFWKEGTSRLDIISEKYYSNPFFDFLILYANPDYLSEFDIPDDTLIRIPFPLDMAIADYESQINIIKSK